MTEYKPVYMVVKVNPLFVKDARNMMHESGLIDGDIPFSPDGDGWFFRSSNRDADLSKYDRLATVYETTINHCKDLRNKVRNPTAAERRNYGC